ncbi:MAG: hypothetical protein H0T88_09435 [Lysobacter sp.]|nr:hypothetical protein [Lysobacter sp.]
MAKLLDVATIGPRLQHEIARRAQTFFGGKAIAEYSEHSAEGRLFRSLKKHLPDREPAAVTRRRQFRQRGQVRRSVEMCRCCCSFHSRFARCGSA